MRLILLYSSDEARQRAARAFPVGLPQTRISTRPASVPLPRRENRRLRFFARKSAFASAPPARSAQVVI
jgi:hypothetical protein